MNTKKWARIFIRLPNTKRGISSALCDVSLLALAMIVYFTAKTMGYKLGINWLIGFLVGAKLLATPLFFSWAQFAMNIDRKNKEPDLT